MRTPFSRTKRKYDFLDPDEILVDSVTALGSLDLSERKIERPLSRASSILFLFFVIFFGFYLFSRAYALQVRSGDSLFAQSQENRFLMRPIFPPRGVIFDERGKPLVTNAPSFGLAFDRDAFEIAGGDWTSLRERLGAILGKSADYFSEIGFPEGNDLRVIPKHMFIAQDISREILVTVAARPDLYPGVEVFESYRRVYQYPLATAHVVGFVGRVSQDELLRNPDLATLATVGKSGVELFYDLTLRGKGGKKIVEVDSSGRETQYRLTEEPRGGANLRLTIDGELQDYIYQAVDRTVKGGFGVSVVALDPKSGAVRALVSYPGFDSNKFGYSLSQKEFSDVVRNPLKPLFNRAISGEFPSGSTFKPIVASATLQENLIDPNKKILDVGYIDILNPFKPGEFTRFVDWKPHGWVDMYDAIANSANVYFYTVGGGFKDQKGLGIERLKKYGELFGLNSKLGIDLPGERPGFFPDPENKKIFDPGDPIWRIGDTYNTSIGQGGLKITPLQLAAATSIIANRGTLYRPYVVDAVVDDEGRVIEQRGPSVIREGFMRPDVFGEVLKGMRRTVTAGSTKILQDVPVAVASKTGTAQVGSKPYHSWITTIAPYENPQLVLVIMVEYSGEQNYFATPLAKEILTWYFTRQRAMTTAAR